MPSSNIASSAQVVAWIKAAGWSGSDAATAYAVAKAESGFNTSAVNSSNSNGTSDYGLFQINSIHNPTPTEKTDGAANAKRAYSIWKSSGWKAWSVYNSGRYKNYLSEAQSAVASISTGGSDSSSANGNPPGLKGVEVESAGTTSGGGTDNGFLGIPGAVRDFQNAFSTFLLVLLSLVLIALGIFVVFRLEASNAIVSLVNPLAGIGGKKGAAK